MRLRLTARLAPSTALRFRIRQAPVQPMAQASAELARSFIFASSALAEEFDSALKLGGSRRRSLKLADEGQQVP